MMGAEEFYAIFKKSEQIGRFYVLPGNHARGHTFRIYLLPKDTAVIENYGTHPPLNAGVVEIYGVVSGNPGWTESYGWVHDGPWVADFLEIFNQRLNEAGAEEERVSSTKRKKEEAEKKRILDLLDDY